MFPRYSSKSSNRFEYVLIEGDYGMKTLNGRVSGYSEDVDNYSSKCQNWVAEIWGLKRLMGKESRVAGGDPTQLKNLSLSHSRASTAFPKASKHTMKHLFIPASRRAYGYRSSQF